MPSQSQDGNHDSSQHHPTSPAAQSSCLQHSTGTSKEDVEFLKILTQSKTATQKELQAHAPQLVAAMAQQGAAIATAIGEQTWLALKEEAECVNKGMDAMILAKTEEIKAHTAP